LPENFLPQHPFNLGKWLTIRDEVLAGWPRKKDVLGSQLAEYYGMVTHLDEQVGRILANLKKSKHAENTIVIYAADHGLGMGSHGLLGKQNVYEHSQRCPLIFLGPGIPQGQSTALTYLHDIFPTVMSLIGLESPNDLDGNDLSGIWEGKISSVRESLFLSFTDHMRSVRDSRYKLIRYPQINHTQLFDLQSDPIEMVNLAEKPEHSSRVEEMTGLLLKWQQELGDDLPLSVDDPLPMEMNLSEIERTPDKWQPEWIIEKYFKVQNR
jgi:arylsulfatase A-like enzyme